MFVILFPAALSGTPIPDDHPCDAYEIRPTDFFNNERYSTSFSPLGLYPAPNSYFSIKAAHKRNYHLPALHYSSHDTTSCSRDTPLEVMPEIVTALHDFVAEDEEDLPFSAGDRIEIIEKDGSYDDGWWKVCSFLLGRRWKDLKSL